MKIKKFTIQNFKCLGPDPIDFDFSDDILVLIGENNVGKSSVLKALDIYFSGTKTMPVEYFFNKQNDQTHAVVITVVFNNLTNRDKVHLAISPYISQEDKEDVWILRKSYYYLEDGSAQCDYIAIVNGEEKRNPTGRPQNCDDLFTDEKMQKIYIEAIKSISDVTEGNTKAVFGQLFNLILRNDLEKTPQFKELLGAFQKYAALFKGGTQLPKIKEIEGKITERLSRIIPAKSLIDAEVPKVEKILPTPNILANDGREITTSPEEQGHGFQRALIFALLELLAETKSPASKEIGPRNLLMIEEPEIYMHPQMIRKITNTLYEIAEEGKAQVILTTHSPFLIRIVDKKKALIRFVRTSENHLKTFQQSEEIFTGGNREEAKERLQMIIRFDPAVNELFFARRVVLLEGDSEFVTLKEGGEFMNVLSEETNLHKKEDTTLINCRGRDFIPLFQKVLNHFQIDYVVIHDTEGQDLNSGANGKILELLNNQETRRKTFSPNIETYLGIQISSRDNKPLKVAEKIKELNRNRQLENKIGDYIKFAYNI
ncbi:MAG: AAA family ATPase [bacterium]|nr:AAA family ATPase [bacterium]